MVGRKTKYDDGLLARNALERLQEYLEAVAASQIVKQRLDRHPRALKHAVPCIRSGSMEIADARGSERGTSSVPLVCGEWEVCCVDITSILTQAAQDVWDGMRYVFQ